MPHLNLGSGVPATVNGVRVGATDFREFAVAPGLPSGITAFGVGANSPSTVLVGNDAFEGNFFSMDGQGGNNEWGFGLDNFFGEMDSGELLCRVFGSFPLEDRHSIGAAASMQGPLDSNFSAWGATQYLRSGSDIETEARAEFSGSFFQIIQSADVQEPFIDGIWFWLRVRRIPNVADPARDDWEARSWYGGIGAEPASPDGVATSQFRFASGALNVGWWMLGSLSGLNEQKIAFMSFSADPLTEPPPLPSDIGESATWIPHPLPLLPEEVFPPAPKPTGIARPIAEFDIRKIRSDDLEYADGDSVLVLNGGVGWQDIEITDPQGRTDCGLSGFGIGNCLFVKGGWNAKRGIDAVRFVGNPINDPQDALGNSMRWPGGGVDPQFTNWVGNEYTCIGVMRCTDISDNACLMGGVSGIIPTIGNPKKTGCWVRPDGSVAMHHMDEETGGSSVQPGSSYSLQSEPGIVKAGDSIILTWTHSTTSGAILRVNGKIVASNPNATRILNQMSSPALGEYQPQQAGPGPSSVGGKDRLIVYFAAFGTLMTLEEIEEYEKFLALTFQVAIGTEWKFKPPPVIVAGDTPWISFDPPPQPVIAEQRIQIDSRGPEPLPLVEEPLGSGFFGTWPDGSGSTVPGAVTISGTGTPKPTWQEKGWDPLGRALGVVDFSTLSCHMNINDGGLGLGYNAGPQGDPQGRRVTVFFVVEATDLTQGNIVLIGGNDNRDNRNMLVGILQDGSVVFNYGGGGDNDTSTAPGLVAEGDRLQITCRAGDGGRIIRVNGVEEGSSIGTSTLITYPTMFIGNYRFFEGSPMKLAWYSGHNIEVSDTEILEMEAFLVGAFFTPPPPPPTAWGT